MSAINPTPRRYASASLRVSVWMLATFAEMSSVALAVSCASS